MNARKRVQKYRSIGGAADLARVEVLVPPAARDKVVAFAARLRADHRNAKELERLYDSTLALYRTRIQDNVDLDRLPDPRSRAAVVARALIDRGDARAFALGQTDTGAYRCRLILPAWSTGDCCCGQAAEFLSETNYRRNTASCAFDSRRGLSGHQGASSRLVAGVHTGRGDPSDRFGRTVRHVGTAGDRWAARYRSKRHSDRSHR
jgi:hypothetical protein